ncbi:MAG: hypothetical protein K0Q49_467 [Haloplasmataceae bacterium]|jgi:hypothetical protein|nr:hypothetical protein [Haloplasmataceae bacterium]
MKKPKLKENSKVSIDPNIDLKEYNERESDLSNLSNMQFSSKRKIYMFSPVKLNIKGKEHDIHFNYCTDPLCKWYGSEQILVKGKRKRRKKYKLTGNKREKSIACQDVIGSTTLGRRTKSHTILLSNWSIATEIKRLIDINDPNFLIPVYDFHKENCKWKDKTVFTHPDDFKYNGENSANSERWICRKCFKDTSIIADYKDNYLYGHKVEGVIEDIITELTTTKGVNGVKEAIKIGSKTFYNKVDFFYQKCLEFLEKHESKVFKNKEFNSLWLSTDSMILTPNFQKKKGYGGTYFTKVKIHSQLI